MKILFGSAFAIFSGWFAALLVLAVVGSTGILDREVHFFPDNFRTGLLFFALGMGAIIGPVWLLLLLPICFLVPVKSTFWRWPVCTPLGILLAPLVLALIFRGFDRTLWLPFALSAVVGGVTFFTASLSHSRFQAATPVA